MFMPSIKAAAGLGAGLGGFSALSSWKPSGEPSELSVPGVPWSTGALTTPFTFSFPDKGAAIKPKAVVKDTPEDSEKVVGDGDDDDDGDDCDPEDDKFGYGMAPILKTAEVIPDETPAMTGEENEIISFTLINTKLYKFLRKSVKPVEEKPALHANSLVAKEVTEVAEVEPASEVAVEAKSSETASAKETPSWEWRECGVGTLRLLVPNLETPSAGRVVMRRDKTETLLLNVSLKGVTATSVQPQGDKGVRFSCLDLVEGVLVPTTCLLKAKDKGDMRSFLTAFESKLTPSP
jgi:hypothetical protein